MNPRLLLLAIPLFGLGLATGCDHHDHDHHRAGRDTDVIVVPARGERFDRIDRNNDGEIGRGEWRHRNDHY